ncbi:MAG: NAD(P)/FAD-dependent oxidoreductase [Eubacteriales bacterium]|nr:NAD(P)/FAD-dependent oxidoreductase [Eubacteriales bacterium]
MDRVNVAIIGNGPAGISAAITAKARNKSILLFGSSKASAKVEKAHQINNYPGLPAVSGSELAAALNRHLEQMEITLTEEQISKVYAMGDYYMIQTAAGMYEADTVILATGVVMGKPLQGENEFLGRGVSYCATCDAMFYKNKPVAVIGYNEEAASEAEFLASVCSQVYYLPVGKAAVPSGDNITILSGKVQSINGDRTVNELQLDSGSVTVDGVFVLRDAVAPETLVPGLEIDGAHAKVDLQMRTNLPGLFACGDIAGLPYQYIKSAGQGNTAALSAVSYLSEKKQKQ